MLTFLRKKMKVILIIVVVIFVASMFYGVGMSRFGGGGTKDSGGLVKINGKEIDPARYREIMNRLVSQLGVAKLRPQDLPFISNLALGQTVDFTLILEQAKKKVRVSNREVAMAIENIIKQEKLESEENLKEALKRVGLTMRQFEKLIKDEMLVQKMVTKIRTEVIVTPNDLREIRASHILVSTEAEANQILEKISKGEDFRALAIKYSKDAGTRARGGDLGFFATGAMVSPFEKVAFKLKIDEVSPVVKTSFGYHIIKLSDSRLRKFEGDEKDIDKAALLDKQEKAFGKWFNNLKSSAKIEIINPELSAHDLRFKGRVLEAINEYKKAILVNPGNPYLHVFLADTYEAIGKKDLALSEYEAAVAIEGANFDLHIILAQAYEKTGEKDKALLEYKKASMLAGDNKALHEALLKIFTQLKAWDEVAHEKAEIVRIEKKEKFEAELK